jgi:hypothetical protein
MLKFMAQLDNTKLEVSVGEEPAVDRLDAEEGPRFPELLIVGPKRKSLIFKFVGGVAVLSVIAALLLANSRNLSTPSNPAAEGANKRLVEYRHGRSPRPARPGAGARFA